MKHLSKIILLVSVLFVGTFTAPGAFAATITAVWTGWDKGAVLSDGNQYGYATGQISPIPGGGTGSVGLGGDQFYTTSSVPFADAGGYFNGWCVDINNWLANPSSFVVGNEADLVSAFSSARVDALITLADERYSTLNSREDSAAFQQAVWAIMFGTPDKNGKYVLQSSTFWVNSLNVGYGEASDWLMNLDTATKTANYDVTYLYLKPAGTSQAMVVFTPAPVPEPGTFFLLGAGLLGLGLYGRKRIKS
jgi:hypothetical protein